MMSLVFVTIWNCRTHVTMTSSVERTDLDFKISVALRTTYGEYPQHMFLWRNKQKLSLNCPQIPAISVPAMVYIKDKFI